MGAMPLGTTQREAADSPANRRKWLLVAGTGIGLLLLIGLVVKLMR